MDKKYILLILVIIVLICAVIGLAVELQRTKTVPQAVNNTVNNTSVNTTVEHINSDDKQQSSQNEKVSTKSGGDENPKHLKKDENGKVVMTQAENGYWYATTNDGHLKGAGHERPY